MLCSLKKKKKSPPSAMQRWPVPACLPLFVGLGTEPGSLANQERQPCAIRLVIFCTCKQTYLCPNKRIRPHSARPQSFGLVQSKPVEYTSGLCVRLANQPDTLCLAMVPTDLPAVSLPIDCEDTEDIISQG